MFKNYQVQFSEDDLFHFENGFGRMYNNITPTPSKGQHLIRPQGLYVIEDVSVASWDNNFDITLRLLNHNPCQKGDVIIVANKDKLYRCFICDENGCQYQKIGMFMLWQGLVTLEERFNALKSHVDSTIS